MSKVIVAILIAATACAAQPFYQDTERVPAALKAAEEYWGQRADIRAVKFTPLKSPVEGYWDAATKTIFLGVQNYSDDRLKAVVTHEYGHALGKVHSQNPEDVMYPSGVPRLPVKMAPCKDNCYFSTSEIRISTGIVRPPDYLPHTFVSIQPPTIKEHCEGEVLICISDKPDYAKILTEETQWTFSTPDGKEYTLTGAKLMDLVKSATGDLCLKRDSPGAASTCNPATELIPVDKGDPPNYSFEEATEQYYVNGVPK